jgi:hypothetical protein
VRLGNRRRASVPEFFHVRRALHDLSSSPPLLQGECARFDAAKMSIALRLVARQSAGNRSAIARHESDRHVSMQSSRHIPVEAGRTIGFAGSKQ